MRVGYRLYATLRRYRPEAHLGKTTELTLPDGATVEQLIQALSIPRNVVKTVFVNGIHRDDDYVLQEGDEAGIFPPIAGGV